LMKKHYQIALAFSLDFLILFLALLGYKESVL